MYRPGIRVNKESHNIKVVTKSGYLWDINQQDAIEKGNLIHDILSIFEMKSFIIKLDASAFSYANHAITTKYAKSSSSILAIRNPHTERKISQPFYLLVDDKEMKEWPPQKGKGSYFYIISIVNYNIIIYNYGLTDDYQIR